MFPLIDLIVGLGGLIVPPAFDFIKKKFVKEENDTPERTLGSLATTKPEVLPDYIDGLAKLKDAEVKYFNRDVIGVPSQWVVNLRAAIRPIGVILAFVTLIAMVFATVFPATVPAAVGAALASEVMTGVRITCELMVSSWFGHRISISK